MNARLALRKPQSNAGRSPKVRRALALAVATTALAATVAIAQGWFGWRVLPGDGHTDAPMAATSFDRKLWLFAKGVEGGLWYQTRTGATWNGTWISVGDGRTDANPAVVEGNAVQTNYRLWLFAKGVGGLSEIWVKSRPVGSDTWTPWTALPGLSSDRGPAAVHTGRLVVFARNRKDQKIYMNQAFPSLPLAWTGWAKVGDDKTSQAPAAVYFPGSGLEIQLFTQRAADQKLRWNRYRITTRRWTGWSTIGGTTNAAPAAATDGSKTYLFVKGGVDRRVYLNSWDGSRWSGWEGEPGGFRTSVGLATTFWDGRFRLFASRETPDRQIFENSLR